MQFTIKRIVIVYYLCGMANAHPEWFKDWFNSHYYHILYQHRNDTEASDFTERLSAFLHLNKEDRIWDLACGKGRHAIKMAQIGFRVIGTDLAENSIQEANRYANDHLEFFVHDMRRPFRSNYFNVVTNLFTSIGYFQNDTDNYKVFSNVYNALKPGGYFIIDFFNTACVKASLIPEADITRDEITFHIKKRIENKRVIKTISFQENGKTYYFEERVTLLTETDFMAYANAAGLKLLHRFGNYRLEPFSENTNSSDRLILVFQK